MATAPTVSNMSTTNSYFALRGEIIRVANWIEGMRDRLLTQRTLSSYWNIRSSWLLSKHRALVTQLEELYISTESHHRPSVLSPIRREYRRLWKSVPDSPSCPVAKNERERTVLAFGYDPGRPPDATTRAQKRELNLSYQSETAKFKSDLIKEYCEDLATKSAFVRQQEFRHRIITESVGREDWFVVFNTLTVNNENYDHVWGDREQHSKVWQNYIARITYDVGLALGLKKREYRQADIHRYAAVVESGSKHGRLHIHVVHFLKELPNAVVDPNRGRSIPSYLEICAFAPYWPYGYSAPRAVRFNSGDSYGLRGWRWPVQRSKHNRAIYVPLRQGTIISVAHYLAKYLAKDVSGKDKVVEGNRWHYRTKMTRGFGLDPYRELMKSLTLGEVRKVCMEPMVVPMLMIKGWRAPQALMIREATREYLRRISIRGSTKIYSILHGITPQMSIVKQFSQILDILMLDNQTLSEEVNIGLTLTGIMRKPNISDEQLQRQRAMLPRVQQKINAIFGEPVALSVLKTGPLDVR